MTVMRLALAALPILGNEMMPGLYFIVNKSALKTNVKRFVIME